MKYSFKERCLLSLYLLKYLWRAKVKRKLMKRLKLKEAESMRYGKVLHGVTAAHQRIRELILSSKPMMVGRMGGCELNAVMASISAETFLLYPYSLQTASEKMQINAGFFPPEREHIKKFSHLIQDCAQHVDVLGSMETNDEEFLVRCRMTEDVLLTRIGYLEPYYEKHGIPWTAALKGKKVLVIYPFADSIRKQYEKRELLYENPDILPEFTLHVLKAVQSIAGAQTGFADWFEALDYMYTEAMKIDFDIAIIGCGAYGFPLAAKLKQAGKQAIHLGGATQLLFGIWGNRWENIPAIKKLKNEHWVRPSAEETPSNAQAVEGACYW